MDSGIGVAWLAVGVLFAVVLGLTALSVRSDQKRELTGSYQSRYQLPSVVGIVASTALLVIVLILGFMSFMPNYRLWRASVEKRILVEEARAQADSAIELARAEVERAKGTAEANHIVAGSITEPYLRYLFINNIAHTHNQIIYLPTEAGLPILEAGRFAQAPE